MARPGQNAKRRKYSTAKGSNSRNRGSDSEGEDEDGIQAFGRVLPVAELPDDFDGVPEDGATYLALVNRESSTLPSFSRVATRPTPGPSSLRSPAAGHSTEAGPSNAVHFPGRDPASLTTQVPTPRPPTSRHPALPTDAWQVLFEAHFLSYRKHLAAARDGAEKEDPSTTLGVRTSKAGVPRAAVRGAWWEYINGKKRRAANQATNNGGIIGDGSAETNGHGELREEEGDEGEEEEGEAEDDMVLDVEVDEEEAMNSAPVVAKPVVAKQSQEEVKSGQAGRILYEGGHEPEALVIESLNSNEALSIISHISEWISESIHDLPPNPCTLMPAHPDIRPNPTSRLPPGDAASDSGSDSDSGTTRAPPLPNPLPARWARWLFALLITLDPGLDSSQLSVLRNLARSCAKVARWRWERALSYDELESHSLDTETAPPLHGPYSPSTLSSSLPGSSTSQPPAPGRTGHQIGTRWKLIRDGLPKSTPPPRPESAQASGQGEHNERGLDEVIARCWLVAFSVVGGWAQRDLVDEFERMFRKVGTGIVTK